MITEDIIDKRKRHLKKIKDVISNLLKIDSDSLTINIQPYMIFMTITIGSDELNIVYDKEDDFQKEAISFSIGGLGSIYSTDTERLELYILAGRVAISLDDMMKLIREVLKDE